MWQIGVLTLGYRPPLRGVSRALRARNPRRVSERVSRGLPAPGSKKCLKQSRKSLWSVKKDCFETPETLRRLFQTLFGPRGRKAPGDFFGGSSGIPGPKGAGDSSKGRTVSQFSQGNRAQFGHFKGLLGFLFMLQIPLENHFLEASRQVEGMCDFTSKPLESLSLFL